MPTINIILILIYFSQDSIELIELSNNTRNNQSMNQSTSHPTAAAANTSDKTENNEPHIICKPNNVEHDIGIDTEYKWIPCKDYLRLEASADPIWRTRNDIDKEIFAILEVLYYYISTEQMSIELECEYTEIICDVMKCNNKLQIESLDIGDYLEPAIEVYSELLKSFSIDSIKKEENENTFESDIPSRKEIQIEKENEDKKSDSFSKKEYAIFESEKVASGNIELNREYLENKYRREKLNELESLKIESNGIYKINIDTFKGLIKLKKLSLKNNEIEEIDVTLFESLSNLQFLDLSSNKLKRIDSNTFKNLTKLERLDLSDNEIKEISVESFNGLSNLTELYLDNNKLKRIDSNTFERLTELKWLSLDHNEIENISVESFNGLSNLIVLSLNNNKLINEISNEVFTNLNNLSELHLSRNKLTKIDSSSISIENLMILNVSSNNIESLSEDFFSSFKNLVSINLSFNKFSKISINLRNRPDSKIYIDLSSNRIEDFSNISIETVSETIFVNLRFNKIQSITNDNLEKAAKYPNIKYDLAYNPLIDLFIEKIGQNSDYQNIFDIKNRDYVHVKKINFENDEIENPIFSKFNEWSNIQKFSILTGKNGIGKSSVLNYIQKTSSDMLNNINNVITIDGVKNTNRKEIQDIISKYKRFFDLLSIDIDDDLLNSESKFIIKKLYIPIIYKMHDTIRLINTPIMNIKDSIERFYRERIKSQEDRIFRSQFNQNLIEIFFLKVNENNDIFDTLILKNFGNKLDILNEHLKNREFKYKIDKNKDGLIEFVDENKNKVRSEHMSPGEQLKMLFYIWEFTLSRFRLPFTFVLLLDEPDAHLDPKAVHEFIEILEKLSEAGAQIIMATHNPITVSFAKEKNLFYMKENEDNSITIHKAKSKADAIYELTENLVAVNIPFLTILVEGNDNRFYELVRQKFVDLGNSYACQFIFKSFGGCQHIIDFLIIQLDDDLKEEIYKIVNDFNKSETLIKLISQQKQHELSLDHFGIIDNDNYLEICSNEKETIKEYYSKRDKNVYNLLRHSLENYVLDPISLYFYLKHLNNSNNQNLKIDRNGNFQLLIDKINSNKIKDIKIGEIKDLKIQKKLDDIKNIDEFIDWEIDHKDKIQILQTIVNIIGEHIINYLINFLTESMSLKPRLFHDKHISNQTSLLSYVGKELSKKTTRKEGNTDYIWINFYISEIKDVDKFKRLYDFKKKIINKKGLEIEKIKGNETIKDKSIKDIIDNPPKIPSIKDEKSFNDFFEIYKSFIKKMKEIIRTYNLKENEYTEDINGIDDLLNYYYEINKYTDIKDIDISILQDFSRKNDNYPLNNNTTVTKQQLKDYIDFKYKLDKKLVELIKKDLEETIECHFVYKNNKDIKIDYPKVFYCLQGHYLEETVCKMFFKEDSLPRDKNNKVIYNLVKEILKEDGLFEKCGYLIPNELKEIFDQINTIKENLLEEEKREKLRREKEDSN